MSVTTDLLLNLTYPQVQQEPIRTLTTVSINPRIEAVIINNHSIRDIGALVNYKHIRSITLIHLRLDTSLSELLVFLGDAERFPALREVHVEDVVFQNRASRSSSPKLSLSITPPSIAVSARRRRNTLRKLTILKVFLPGKMPTQAFIDIATQAINNLTLSELTLELQSDRDNAESNETANLVGLLVAFPNLQTYNNLFVTDQLTSLSRSRTAELLIAMRDRLREAKDLLEDTMLQLAKRVEATKSLKEALSEARSQKERLEEKALSLSATCSTLKAENLRLSQNNDLMSYLGTSSSPMGNQTSSSNSTRDKALEAATSSSTRPAMRTDTVGVQTDFAYLAMRVDRTTSTDPVRPSLPAQANTCERASLHPSSVSPARHFFSEKEELSGLSTESSRSIKEARNYTLLSENTAMDRIELYSNRIGMVTEDLCGQFTQKMHQKNNEIAILIDALMQVQAEQNKQPPREASELSQAKKMLLVCNEEIEQLREKVGTTQGTLQDVLVERDELVTSVSQLRAELAVVREKHQSDLVTARESALIEAAAENRDKLMKSNDHIRLLEDKIVSMEDQIKLQEVELSMAEETHCKNCISSIFTRFGVSQTAKSASAPSSCAYTQTLHEPNGVTVGCQYDVPSSTPPHPRPMLAVESLYSFGIGGEEHLDRPAQVSVSCQVSADSRVRAISTSMPTGLAVNTAACAVQTDHQPELGPELLVSDVLKSVELEEIMANMHQQHVALMKQYDLRDAECRRLAKENKRLHDHNRKLLADCKEMTAELAHQRLRSRSLIASSTLEPSDHEAERTKLLLDLNKALQQRDTYRHNLKKAINYATKLIAVNGSRPSGSPSPQRRKGSSPIVHRNRECMSEGDPYRRRIQKLQDQVHLLGQLKANQTETTQTIIGKTDMLRHHDLYPRKRDLDFKDAPLCTPAMSQELIDSLEELAKRVDAMLPSRLPA